MKTPVIAIAISAAFMTSANAQVNKCVIDGRVTYSESPCPDKAKAQRPTEEELQRLYRAKENAPRPDEETRRTIQEDFERQNRPIEEARAAKKADCAAWLASPDTIRASSYDGSVSQVTRYLKSTLVDPDSLVTEQWGRITRTCDGYEVRIVYRAKNGFGGYVREAGVFLVTRQGGVIQIR